MRYADFAFYRDSYCGKIISETEFNYAAERASDRINECVFGREIPDKFMHLVKRCCCDLAEQIYKFSGDNSESGGAISSEKVGEYSVTYRSNSERIEAEEKLKNICYSTISRHLAHTGLLYRGVD